MEDTVSKQVQFSPVQTDLSVVIFTVRADLKYLFFLYWNVLHVLADRGALAGVYIRSQHIHQQNL